LTLGFIYLKIRQLLHHKYLLFYSISLVDSLHDQIIWRKCQLQPNQ
jgi:hypothetical protein